MTRKMTLDLNAYHKLWSVYQTYIMPPSAIPEPKEFREFDNFEELQEPFKSRWAGFKSIYMSLRMNSGYHVKNRLIKELQNNPKMLKRLKIKKEDVAETVNKKVEKWNLPTPFEQITPDMWFNELRSKCLRDKWADVEMRHYMRTMFMPVREKKPMVDRRPFEKLIHKARTAREWGLKVDDDVKRTLPQMMDKYRLTVAQRIAAFRAARVLSLIHI